MAKWLMNLGEEKRDSLKKSILKEKGRITWSYVWELRSKLDENFPKKPVRISGTDMYFISPLFDESDTLNTIAIEKKEDEIIIWDKDKKKEKFKIENK